MYNQELDESNVKLLQLVKHLRCKICVFCTYRKVKVVINVKRMPFTYGQAISFSKVPSFSVYRKWNSKRIIWFFVW